MVGKSPNLICVEVAFALPSKQRVVVLEVLQGTTAADAVRLADLPSLFPEVGEEIFEQGSLGIFGKVLKAPAQHRLSGGERVEVYRPLEIDPKAARLARAQKQQQQ
ncbi:MAG: RnfH family protein [Pseudomonadota bacterium]|jgi:putative ubiquitin-RnfH superfamily antitoxin RatB of RatAB toxin-antitoxin module